MPAQGRERRLLNRVRPDLDRRRQLEVADRLDHLVALLFTSVAIMKIRRKLASRRSVDLQLPTIECGLI
jgi:hypothetical protein